MKQKIFLIAGEVSGDLHGSLLIRELKKLDPSLEFYALGGQAMEREGARILYDLPSIAALGLGDVLRQYFTFRKIFYETLDKVTRDIKPDLIILIDYPGFNIRFAKKIAGKIPVLYYISPQVWAWGKRRIKTIARNVGRMVVFLPFEVDVYKDSGLKCEFVGHPLVELVKPSKPVAEIRREWGFGDKSLVISLLPGSRRTEVKRILPVMLEASKKLLNDFPDARFLLSEAPNLPKELFDGILSAHSLDVKRVRNRSYDAAAASDFCLVTSGTATLETAIAMKPFVILYKTAVSTYWIGRSLIQIPYIGLINVLAGEKIVPEFIQHDAEPGRIAAESARILKSRETRSVMIDKMKKAVESLGGPGAAERAAACVLNYLNALATRA